MFYRAVKDSCPLSRTWFQMSFIIFSSNNTHDSRKQNEVVYELVVLFMILIRIWWEKKISSYHMVS